MAARGYVHRESQFARASSSHQHAVREATGAIPPSTQPLLHRCPHSQPHRYSHFHPPPSSPSLPLPPLHPKSPPHHPPIIYPPHPSPPTSAPFPAIISQPSHPTPQGVTHPETFLDVQFGASGNHNKRPTEARPSSAPSIETLPAFENATGLDSKKAVRRDPILLDPGLRDLGNQKRRIAGGALQTWKSQADEVWRITSRGGRGGTPRPHHPSSPTTAHTARPAQNGPAR